jgi:hypothetical protein
LKPLFKPQRWLPAGFPGPLDTGGRRTADRLRPRRRGGEPPGQQPGNLGFYLPALDKNALFKTVILDGSLPRKTFSWAKRTKNVFTWNAAK